MDGKKFCENVYKYRDDLYIMALAILRNETDAEDAVSNAILKAYENRGQIKVFPTDIQTYHVSKAAKKQYTKLVRGIYEVLASIRPVKNKRTGKQIYRVSDFSLKLPKSWLNHYTVKKSGKKKDSYVAFYAKKCYNQTKAGFLFSIARYTDESYRELPSYELVGMWNGINYVAVYPTDVQSEGASKTAAKLYRTMSRSAEKTARSIEP